MSDSTLSRGRVVARRHDEILLFDAASGEVLRFQLPDLLWTDVVRAADDYAIMEGESALSNDLLLSVVRLAPRLEVTGRLDVGAVPQWEGDSESWRALPPVYAMNVNGIERALVLVEHDVGVTRRVRLPLSPGQTEPDGTPYAVQLPFDRSIVVCEGRGRYAMRVDATTGEVRRVLELPSSLASRPTPLVRGNTELWVAAWDGVLRIDADSGAIEHLPLARLRDDSVVDLALDSSGRRCAVALASSGAIVVLDADAMNVMAVVETTESLQRLWVIDDDKYVAQVWGEDRFVTGALSG